MIRTPLLALALALPTSANALCLCLKCLSGGFRHFETVSEAMSPTLPPGTCLTVALRTPETPLPQPGQIIAFTDPASGVIHIFRMVAGPGQTVQMQDGAPVIDGQPVLRRQIEDYAQAVTPNGLGMLPRCPTAVPEGGICPIPRFIETLPNGTSHPVIDLHTDSPGDRTEVLTVPPGHILVLGDNRDNAADSRFAVQTGGRGFVPVETIIGTFDAILSP